MWSCTITALLLSWAVSAHEDKIIGGSECTAHSQPWQVSLQSVGKHRCGGTLINKCWVLTAAHCQNPFLQIVLGDHNIMKFEETEQITYAAETIPHPDFSWTSYANDIMLLRLATPAVFNEYVQAIPLATACPPEGTSCSVSGWGTVTSPDETYPEVLQCVDVKVIGKTNCAEAYPDDEITEGMLCAGVMEGDKDSCQGDSGGPLVCNGELSGIVSWGNIPCAEPGMPGVYTKVYMYLDWINKTIAAHGKCDE